LISDIIRARVFHIWLWNISNCYPLFLEHVGALDVGGLPVGNIQPLVQPLLLKRISHKSSFFRLGPDIGHFVFLAYVLCTLTIAYRIRHERYFSLLYAPWTLAKHYTIKINVTVIRRKCQQIIVDRIRSMRKQFVTVCGIMGNVLNFP
jgi:hypothetical protein